MEYMTLKEAGEKWGISARQINYYCVAAFRELKKWERFG